MSPRSMGIPPKRLSLGIGPNARSIAQFRRERSRRYRGGPGSQKEPGEAPGREKVTTAGQAKACNNGSGSCSDAGLTVASVCPAAAMEHSPSGSRGQSGSSSPQQDSSGSQQALAVQGDAAPPHRMRARHRTRINMRAGVYHDGAYRGPRLVVASYSSRPARQFTATEIPGTVRTAGTVTRNR